MITPSQISEVLGVPASTVRRWAAAFEAHLSPRRGKKRLYTPADLDLFRRIRDLSAEGFSLKEINKRLGVIEPLPTDQGAQLLVLSDFAKSLEAAHNQVDQLRLLVEDQAAQLADQAARLERLEGWARLPWYQRIGKKPPG